MNDKELVRQLGLQKELAESLSSKGSAALENTLSELGNRFAALENNSNLLTEGIPLRKYLLAASIGIISMIGTWVLISQFSPSPSPEELYATNFEFPQVPTLRGANLPKKLESAYSPYRAGNYQEALAAFNALEKTYPREENILLYAGVCALSLNRETEAVLRFQTLIDLPDPQFKEYAQWYLGLTYLKLNQPDIARKYFEVLTVIQNRFNDRSKNILNSIY